MTFAHGAWLVVGALSALAILCLHLFRPRRRTVRVSSLYLWRDVEREIASNKRRKRILTSILLALQLLGVLAIAVALADPARSGGGRGFELAVVVDTSASMGLFEPGGTRLELAVKQLERYLSEGDADRYSLWNARDGAVLYDGTSKAGLLAALRRLPPPAGVSDWELTSARLAAMHTPAGRLHTVIATDGALPAEALSGFADVGPEISVIQVGTPYGNIGITGFSARPVGEDPYLHEVLVSVSNMSGSVQRVRLVVESDRRAAGDQGASGAAPLREATLVIPPQSSQKFVFEHRFEAGEALAASIGAPDLFDADNTAYLAASFPGATRTLFVGGSSYLLRQGFAVFPQVVMAETLGAPPPGASYDLTVFYDRPVPDDFTGDALVLVSGRGADLGASGAQVTWWNRAHPLSRFVEWDQINIGPAAPLSVGPGESVLVESTLGPIATVREEAVRRIVRLSIPVERSDFPFRTAFPVFLQNLIEWVNPEGAALVPAPVPPGTLPAHLAAAIRQGDSLRLSRRDDPSRSIEAGRTGETEAAAFLAGPGVYVWESGGRTGSFTVSLLDAEESDLSPRLGQWTAHGSVRLVPVGAERLIDVERSATPAARAEAPEREGLDLWELILTVLALAAIFAEGTLYARTHGPSHPAGPAAVLSRFRLPAGRTAAPKGGARA